MQIQATLSNRNFIRPILFKLVQTQTEKCLQVLYIGSATHFIQSAFPQSVPEFSFTNFEGLIFFIKKYNTQEATIKPDVILLDVTFNQVALEKLHLILSENMALAKVPVLYNAKLLTINQAIFSKKLGLIDDSIDFEQSKIISRILQKERPDNYRLLAKSTSIVNKDRIRNIGYFLKTVFDSSVALFAFLLLLPIFILIALAIKMESKGPVFYSSLRAGRGYKVFKFYKFRSMGVDADKKVDALRHLNQYDCNIQGPSFFKISNDPRITKVGKFLRNTSLDELPQLINVIKGDMSLVGNRPLPLYEAETLVTDDYVERFMAPAGITGLWQVKKRGKPEMSIEERIKLDVIYARKASPMLDFKILASTPYALFQKSDV